MPIVISCPNAGCGRRYTVPDEAAGRTATCASCGTKIQITAGAKPAAAPTPAPSRKHSHEVDPDLDIDAMTDMPTVTVVGQRGAGKRGGFGAFAAFRTMIALRVLVALYWLSVLLVVLSSAGMIVYGIMMGGPNLILGTVAGVINLILTPIVLRVSFEITIVLFRIHETLNEIRDLLNK
jgi:hypothetical protein